MDGVRTDTLARVLDGRGLRHETYGSLRGLILRAAVVCPDEPKLRRDIDDRATTGLTHRGNRGLGPEEHALGVDGHHAVPVLDGGLLYPRSAADARIVHENGQSAEAALGDADRALPFRLARHVEQREDRLAALRLDLRFDAAALG